MDGKQNIKLNIGGKSYQLGIDPAKEEMYRLAEREVNARASRFGKAKVDGFAMQDCLAMSALELAISNIGMSRSREVGNEDVRELADIAQRIADYVDTLKL
ncbi:MAG: cell division protein ZapA [Alistipes sp.]|nr:cell division protein ZapA [Alistipes sp.]